MRAALVALSHEFWHYWVEQQFFDAFFEVLATQTGGMAMFATLITVPLMIMLWSWSRSTVIPAVVLALLGGTIMQSTTGFIASIGGRLVIVVAAGMGLLAWLRLNR